MVTSQLSAKSLRACSGAALLMKNLCGDERSEAVRERMQGRWIWQAGCLLDAGSLGMESKWGGVRWHWEKFGDSVCVRGVK